MLLLLGCTEQFGPWPDFYLDLPRCPNIFKNNRRAQMLIFFWSRAMAGIDDIRMFAFELLSHSQLR